VGRAVEASVAEGDRSIFLLADEHGAPRRLYERLGFRVLCRCTGFTSPLSP
jgi:predicted GNAT family acetyltransferase